MICPYHLRRMSPIEATHIPFDTELSGMTRTPLRCPVLSCFCVGMEYDTNKIDERRCQVCKTLLSAGQYTDDEPLTSLRCRECKRRYGLKYRQRKDVKARIAREKVERAFRRRNAGARV